MRRNTHEVEIIIRGHNTLNVLNLVVKHWLFPVEMAIFGYSGIPAITALQGLSRRSRYIRTPLYKELLGIALLYGGDKDK